MCPFCYASTVLLIVCALSGGGTTALAIQKILKPKGNEKTKEKNENTGN